MSSIVLPHTSASVRVRCYGTGVAEAISVCLSPYCSAPQSFSQSSSIASCSILDLMSLLEGSPWEISNRRDLNSQARETIFNSRSEI